MSDVHNQAVRSYNMSRIKGRDTKPELLVRKALTQNSYRYRLHVETLPGRPDIVMTKLKVAIFVHGCFWHGHENCQYFKLPKTRASWWAAKIQKTKLLDEANVIKLKALYWNVIEIWECDLRGEKLERTLFDLLNQLESLKHDTENKQRMDS